MQSINTFLSSTTIQISRVLRTSLSSHGYDIRVANDGETALEIMKDWTPI